MKATALWAIGCAAVLYSPLLLAYAAPIWGSGWRAGGVELLAVAVLGFMMVAICAVPFLLWRRVRTRALSTLVFSGIMFLAVIPALYAAWSLRSYGFHLVARRAEPLLAAIELYVSRTGRPPETLDALIPHYLPAMPDRIPPLEIITGDRARRNYYGNDWVLTADVSTGLLNWDEFIYLPNQRYPDRVSFERIGRWAYYHE
jgi:hypothetical protein